MVFCICELSSEFLDKESLSLFEFTLIDSRGQEKMNQFSETGGERNTCFFPDVADGSCRGRAFGLSLTTEPSILGARWKEVADAETHGLGTKADPGSTPSPVTQQLVILGKSSSLLIALVSSQGSYED